VLFVLSADPPITQVELDIKDVLSRRCSQSYAIQPELVRLDEAIGSLAAVRKELSGGERNAVGANLCPADSA
jgi:hypothetical protein